MMNKSVTPTIEGGLLVAITVVLGLVTVYVPIIGLMVEFFCAVPLAVLTARQGAGKGLTALVVSFLLLSILISPLLSMRIALTFGLSGVVLGWGVKNNFAAVKIFLSTLIVASAAQVLMLAMATVIMDINIIETQLEVIRESFAESFQMYESMGVDPARINDAKNQVEPALQTLALMVPTILMFTALTTTAATYLTAKWIFPKLQIKMPQFPPFAEWKFPAIFFYMGIVSGLGLYWGVTRGWTQIEEITLNLLILSAVLGIVEGFSLLSAMLDRYKISKFMRWFLYVILILNAFLLQTVAIVGLMDMIFDYRKRFLSGK